MLTRLFAQASKLRSLWFSFENCHKLWGTPVGLIKAILTSHLVQVPGSYYATSPAVGLEAEDFPMGDGLIRSQAFLAQVATRAVVFIEADNVDIGLVAFLAIGMDEVGSCDLGVTADQRVAKGEELGTFRFGGSSWCLLLREEVKIQWEIGVERIESEEGEGEIIKVNERIATVESQQ